MFLCIDTATAESGVALVTSEKSLGFLKLETMKASEKILGSIDQLIQGAGIQVKDLKGIFVVKGPGSFTGLRVGIAVANQFAHQLEIPIIGLQTEELYAARTDEQDFVYLQTMNRDQVYMVGFGSYADGFPQSIIAISEAHHELSANGAQWLGQVSEGHKEVLLDVSEVEELRSAEEMWLQVVQGRADEMSSESKKYDLVEPFYGKEPTITKSARKLGV